MLNKQSKLTKKYKILKILTLLFLLQTTKPSKVIKISTDEYYTQSRNGSIFGGTMLHILADSIDTQDFQNQILIGDQNCPINNYYTTKTTLACQIPKGYYLATTVQIRVLVKNKDLICNHECYFTFHRGLTPYITSLIPNSIFAGETLQISGFLVAEKVDDFVEVSIGGFNCDVNGEERDMDWWNRYEYLRCKIGNDLQPGFYDFNVRNKKYTGFAGVLKQASGFDYETGKRFDVKVHPKIEGLSSGEGFATGVILDVKGVGFGSVVGDVVVQLEGFSVEVLDVRNDNLKVKIGNSLTTSNRVVFEGGIGVERIFIPEIENFYYNLDRYMDATTYPLLDKYTISLKLTIDSIVHQEKYIERYKGLFKAPVTGNYKFKLSSDDQGILKISTDPVDFDVAFDEKTMMGDLCTQSSHNSYRSFYFNDDLSQICNKNLIAGKYYYIIAMHREGYGIDSLSLTLQIPNTDETRVNKSPKVSKIILSNNQINEKVSIKVWNAAGGTFQLTYIEVNNDDVIIYNEVVNNIPFDVDSTTLISMVKSQAKLKTSFEIVRYNLDNSGNRDPAYVNPDGGYEWVFDYTTVRANQVLPVLNSSGLLGNKKTKVETLVNPSPKISGSFKIQIIKNDSGVITIEKSEEIEFSVHNFIFAEILMKLDMIDDGINVERRGKEASGYTWHIIWDSLISKASISYTIQIVESTIAGGNPSTPASISIQDAEAASNNLFYYQIPSEFLSTFHETPQINVKINGIRAGCSNFNCGYSLLPSANIPTVETWSVNNKIISLNLSAGYDSLPDSALLTMENLSVTFGDSVCQVDSVSLPNFTCTLPTNRNSFAFVPAGLYKPVVHLKNRGFLNINLDASSFSLTVTSVTPANGSVSGGTSISIVGTGFSSNSTVTVGGNACEVKSSNNVEIICVTPAGTNGSTTIIVTQGSITANSNHFSYSLNFTPIITNLSITSASPVLKNDLTISGTSFGTDKTKLKVELISQSTNLEMKRDYLCNIISAAEDEILCRLGGGFSADYKILITRIGFGYSKPSALNGDKFTYGIFIDSISPVNGSKEGGSILTITGANFSSKTNETQVLIGNNQDYCVVQTASPTQLTCKTNKPKTELTGLQNVAIIGRLIEEATCRGTCKFEFKQSETPSVTSISPLLGISNTEITITGTDFNTSGVVITLTKDEVSEEISSSLITSITNTKIIFNYPMMEFGFYLIDVNVEGKGSAVMPINRTFINIFQLISVSPKTGFYGGNKIIINGNGFIETDEVLIDGKICINKEFINNTLIKCRMAERNLFATSLPIILRRVITDITCTTCNYLTFAENLNARISEIKPSSFTIGTNKQITISVTNPGISDMSLVTVSLNSNVDGSTFDATSVSLNSDNKVEAVFGDIPVGDYKVDYFVSGKGYARLNADVGDIRINLASVSSFTFNAVQSSFAGGKIAAISGNGFKIAIDGSQVVKVCGLLAKILTSTYNQITFETPMISSKVTNDKLKMVKIKRLNPVAITANDGTSEKDVNDGDFSTYFNSSSDSCWFQYDFGLGHKALIDYISFFPRLDSDEKYLDGAFIKGSNDGLSFTTIFSIKNNVIENWNEIKPITEGAWNYRFIRFEGKKCLISEFKVFGFNYSSETINLDSHKCDVVYESEGTTLSFTDRVEYREDKTPILTSLDPKMGTTGGGTSITFTGKNLTSTSEIIIDDIPCNLGASTSTTSVCTTVIRPNFTEPSLKIRTADGYAVIGDNKYLYIERWSEDATWGGEAPPREGESVYVPKGQSLLVDVSTPILQAVVVEGNILWEDKKELTFDAHYVFIKGGSFSIGSPENPHLNKLTITLHGKKSDISLPGFGNKLIGVLTGTLDIHGKPRSKTWCLLKKTANAGSNTITVDSSVDWKAGEEIIIAPTGLDNTEFEKRTISSITSEGVITLNEPLKYIHFAETLTHGSKSHEVRAEVGLLTRNILFQGDKDSEKDKYGAHIMLRGNDENVRGRISYIEVYNAGQAFQMGRYPIHFHMIGNVIGSYLEGNSVHQTYNRGTTIHGVHYFKITKSVYYDHLGHGIFWEDSIESNCLVEDNLVMRTKISSSLLFSDLMPAGMWITRPINFIRRNHVAGSDSFGFWYDLPAHPTGPSATKSICPEGEEFGVFEDNVAHTNSIGLRVYPQYKPRTNPCKQIKNYDKLNILEDNPPLPAEFKNTLLFSNAKGFFSKFPGAIVLKNFTFLSNPYGLSYKVPQYEIYDFMPRVEDTIFVGNSNLTTAHGFSTKVALGGGQADGFRYKNVKFINFTDNIFFRSCTKCDLSSVKGGIGVHHTYFQGISFENCSWSEFIQWNFPERGRDVVVDEDGSLNQFLATTGTGGFVTPYAAHLDIAACSKEETDTITSDPILKCPKSIKIRRFDIRSFNSNLKGQKIKIYNINLNGEITDNNMQDETKFGLIDYIEPEKTLKDDFKGWGIPLITNQNYNIHFGEGVDFEEINLMNNPTWENSDELNLKFNITATRSNYNVSFTGFDEGNYVENKTQTNLHNLPANPAKFGEYFYDVSNKKLNIIVTGDRIGRVTLNPIVCVQCSDDPDDVPDENRFRYWNKASDWESGAIPEAGENVVIKPGWKMVLNDNPAEIKNLEILGSLFADNSRPKTIIKAENIWIKSTGEFHIGSQEEPFDKEFEIILKGTKDSEEIVISPLITPINKAIIVAGKMKVHAQTSTTQFTRLKKNALIGEKTIEVSDTVDWKIGDTLILSSTSQNHFEVEYIKIKSITSQKITIETDLKYNHFGSLSPISTSQGILDMRGEVGLLSRKVVIKGTLEDDWGCRILIPGYTQADGQRIDGKIYLEGVLIENCGQRDTDNAALDFNRLEDTAEFNVVSKCSIRDSAGWAINLRSSTHVKIEKNVIANSLKYGVYLKNVKEIHFKENLIIKIRERTWYNNTFEFDLIIGFFYDDEDDMAANNLVIHKNIISSAVWFAWAVPGLQCGSTNNQFTYNVGHSSRAGWFGTKVNKECQEYSLFTAYRNFEEGFVNRFMIKHLKVKNFILSDNNNSIAINGGVTGTRTNSPTSSIKDTLVLGKSMLNCDFCYNNILDCETNGIYTSLFELEDFVMKFNEYKLPLHNSTHTRYLSGGKQNLDNVDFENFQTQEGCTDEKAFVIRTNNFVQDTSVYFQMNNIKTKNVDKENMFFFANHERVKHPCYCNEKDCTGIYNILIDDIDGGFHPENKRQQFFGYNRNIAKDGNCTFIENWNGHECNDVYQLLTILKTEDGGRDTVIAPIYTTIFQNPTIIPQSERFSSIVDNDAKFPIIIKKNSYSNIQYSQTMPDNQKYQINGNNGDYAIFRVQANDPATLVTVVNNKAQTPLIVEENKQIDWQTHKTNCGAHIYFPSNSTIIWVVPTNNCEVKIKKLKTINIAMRLDVDVADFYNDIGTSSFIDKIAALLGIHTSQLKIVGIRKGSTIIDFVIKTLEDSDGGQSGSSVGDNQELNRIREDLIMKVQNGELDVGAPLLNLEAHVVIPESLDDGFVNVCRFFNFGNYTAVLNSSVENRARAEKLEFVDVKCAGCVDLKSCGQYLDNVCKTNSTFIGEVECEKYLNGSEEKDEESKDVEDDVKEDDSVKFDGCLAVSFVLFALLNLF